MLDKEVYYWARLPRTFWENSNILYLEEKDPSCIIFYLKLLSKTLNLNGYCRDEFGKWTIERIRTLTNCSGQKKTEENIQLLIKLKLLEKKNGCLHISNFENLVGFETYKAKRMRDYREKIKEQKCSNVVTNEHTNEHTNVTTNYKEERTKEESKINNKSNNNIYNKRKIEKRNCDKGDKKDKATAVSDGQIKPSNLTSILISKKIIQPNDAFIPEFNNLFDSFCLDEFGDFQQDLFKQTRDNIVYLATTIKHRSSKEKPINNWLVILRLQWKIIVCKMRERRKRKMIWISLIQILLILIKVFNLVKISWFIVFIPAYVLIGTLVLLIVFNRLNKKVVIRRD